MLFLASTFLFQLARGLCVVAAPSSGASMQQLKDKTLLPQKLKDALTQWPAVSFRQGLPAPAAAAEIPRRH